MQAVTVPACSGRSSSGPSKCPRRGGHGRGARQRGQSLGELRARTWGSPSREGGVSKGLKGTGEKAHQGLGGRTTAPRWRKDDFFLFIFQVGSPQGTSQPYSQPYTPPTAVPGVPVGSSIGGALGACRSACSGSVSADATRH